MEPDEQPIDPQRPIIDPHLHLWDIRAAPGAPQEPQTFLLADAAATIASSGHKVTHSVFVECSAMYRPEGPAELRSLGETEFANGMAAMSASSAYGPCRIAHRIVSNVDLMLGEAVAGVLDHHAARAGDRFRGVRQHTAFSEAGLFGYPADLGAREALRHPAFQQGARVLARMGYSLDVWCLHTQLDQLVELADASPELMIILDHIGTPDLRSAYAGRPDEARAEWRTWLQALARRPNVVIKLGGLGMDVSRPIQANTGSATSRALADRWKADVETCIEIFTPQRCMFESNFPPDRAAGCYGAIWNAFKLIAAPYSDDEKDWLFRRTAADSYRIAID